MAGVGAGVSELGYRAKVNVRVRVLRACIMASTD